MGGTESKAEMSLLLLDKARGIGNKTTYLAAEADMTITVWSTLRIEICKRTWYSGLLVAYPG